MYVTSREKMNEPENGIAACLHHSVCRCCHHGVFALMKLWCIVSAWFRGLLFGRKTYNIAIVRRYTDANGSYVGELYLWDTFCGVLSYNQIGMSLDTLPFDCQNESHWLYIGGHLDTDNDFLTPMTPLTVRVGAQDPQHNDAVRSRVGRLAREGRILLQVRNRFIEHVMQHPGKGSR